jgi:hypothetical protein
LVAGQALYLKYLKLSCMDKMKHIIVICEALVLFSVWAYKWVVLTEPGPFPNLKFKLRCDKLKTVHGIR